MTLLGKYELHELLGRGAFGSVYRAYDTSLEIERAIKILHADRTNDLGFLLRFRREALLAVKLDHPGIVPVYELGETEGQYYLVMKYMPGGSLDDLLKKEGPLPFLRAVKILAQVAAGLDFAHEQNIIHRDIKPANILLEKNGAARLGDFGFARAQDSDTSSSGKSLRDLVGTASYIAPEIWDDLPATPASDQYSLACVACEMLTGQVLFHGAAPASIVKSHLRGPQFPAEWPQGTPHGVSVVLGRALDQDPQQRYTSASEFVEEMGKRETAAPPPVVTIQPAPVTAPAAQPAPIPDDEQTVILPKDAVPDAKLEQAAPPVVPPAAVTPVSVPPAAQPAPLPHVDAPVSVLPAPQARSQKKTLLTVGGIVLAMAVIFVIWLAIAVNQTPDYVVKPTQVAGVEATATTAPVVGNTATSAPTAENVAASVPVGDPPPSYTDWPMYGYDSKNTFWNVNELKLTPPLTLAATYPLAYQIAIGDISITAGTILLPGTGKGDNNILLARNEADGKILWTFKLSNGGAFTMVVPAVVNGAAYFGGQDDDDLYGLDLRTGQLQRQIGAMGSMYDMHPKIYNDRLYYLSANEIGSFDPVTHEKIWSHASNNRQSAMAIDSHILVTGGTNLTAMNADTGEVLWQSPGQAGYQVTISNGLVYSLYTGDEPNTIGDKSAVQYIYDRIAAFQLKDGKKVWEFPLTLPGYATGGQLLAYDNILYVHDQDPNNQTLFALNAQTGELIQKREGFPYYRMAGANNVLYTCSWGDAPVLGLNPKTLETVWTGPSTKCAGLVVADGQLFMIDTSYNVQVYK
jgi:outer membrane protein assembly factor BamB/tRNA A-37 threonylcarbamoyl transferase component Bud32